MGKTKKKISSSASLSSSLPSVTILTPTTFDRQDVLHLLSRCIENQSYTNISEWILIDGSRGDKFIDRSFIKCSKCPIRWIEPNGLTIGMLRQSLKDSFSTDIAVCFDDDDYYPPTRVSHAVERLIKTRKQIAGCTSHLVFDLDLGQAFKFRGFNENHATHNTMAFTSLYARTHDYNLEATKAEERNFTNDFSEPMAQLDYIHTVLHMFHSNNTFHKREMSMHALLEDGEKNNLRIWRSKTIASYATIQNYTKLLSPDISSDVPDIVYYLGGWSVYKWEPTTKSLGGSEQAVVELCKEWVARGRTVHVYGDFSPDIIDGIVYKDWRSFNFGMSYKNIILWRHYGAIPFYKVPRLKTQKLLLDLHDNLLPRHPNKEIINLDQLDHIVVKSYFHAVLLRLKKANIIPNGVRTEYFNIDKIQQKDNYRCIYASDYERGLIYMLRWAWPVVIKLVPNATLDVYYGMKLNKKEFQEEIEPLLKQPGVTDHGRCSVETVSNAKIQSSFHLYFSKTNSETDCISIKESAAVGCIPIISSVGVFAERNGLHMKGDPSTKDAQENMAKVVAYLMKNPDTLEIQRKHLSSFKTQDWKLTAEMWSRDVLI